MAFGVDMLYQQKVIVNWERLKILQKQQAINNKLENWKHNLHEYNIGDLVLISTPENEYKKKITDN